MPVRRVARLESGHTPSRQHPEYWENCDTPWFSLADIWQVREGGADYIYETAEKISQLGIQNSAARVLPKGTVMLSRTASVGFAAIMGVDMATTQDFANWVCGPGLLPEFLLQSFRAMEGEFTRLKMGSTHNTIYMPDIQALWCAVPPVDEQAAVVAFLRRELRQIDALIAEQERLIELLKEKRQAVISHAVTKGLNPDAPMKPSGVEWLGEVPEHWDVGLLRRALFAVDYGISESLEPKGAIAVLRMGNIRGGEVVMDDLKFSKDVDPALLLAPGDLLFNRTNSLDLIGKVGLFRGHDAPVSFASYLVRLRAVEHVVPAYLAFLLNTEGMLGIARSLAFVAIGQCNLNPNRYTHIRVAIPPTPEQLAIVDFLGRRLNGIDELLAEARTAIKLLQERVTALVSAAVTGQIDVRGLAGAEVA